MPVLLSTCQPPELAKTHGHQTANIPLAALQLEPFHPVTLPHARQGRCSLDQLLSHHSFPSLRSPRPPFFSSTEVQIYYPLVVVSTNTSLHATHKLDQATTDFARKSFKHQPILSPRAVAESVEPRRQHPVTARSFEGPLPKRLPSNLIFEHLCQALFGSACLPGIQIQYLF